MRVLHLFLSLILLTTTCFGQYLKPLPGMPFVNRTHRLGRGLVAYWPMNERSGKKAFDLSGNGNDLTINNDYLWSAGKFGSVVELLGVTDYMSVPSARIVSNMPELTLSIWFNSDLGGGTDQVLFRLEQIGLYLDFTTVSNIVYTPNVGGGGPPKIPYTFTAGVWYHIVATQDSSNNYAVYVNGVLVASGSTIPLDLTAGFNLLLIGALNEVGTWDFDGKLDLPSIWNRALSAGEIAELYREPFAMFQQANPLMYAGTVAAPPSVVPTPYYYRSEVHILSVMLFVGYCCWFRKERKCVA